MKRLLLATIFVYAAMALIGCTLLQSQPPVATTPPPAVVVTPSPVISPTTLPAAVAAQPTGLTGAEILSTIQTGLQVAQASAPGTPVSTYAGIGLTAIGLLGALGALVHGNSVNATTSQAATAAASSTHAATVSQLTSLVESTVSAIKTATTKTPTA